MKARRTASALGIDVGTSSVKAVLLEVDGGVRVVRSVTVGYDAGGAPARDPSVWVSSALAAVAEAVGNRNVDVVGLTGQMHALVPMAGGRPLRDAMLWLDYQGEEALATFCHRHPELPLLSRTGNIPLPDFMLAKWLVASEADPSLRTRVESLPAAKDVVRLALAPGMGPVADVNEAAGTQLLDPFGRDWDRELAAAAGIPQSALPTVVAPDRIVGETAAGVVGAGVPVVAGTGDQHAAARALGADRPGRASLSLGTSGVLGVALRLEALPDGWDGSLHLFPCGDSGEFQVIGTIPAFGGALRWAATTLDVDLDDLGPLALAGRPGAARFYPYLGGSGAPHPDTSRRAELRGLSEATTRADIARAVIDGLANEVACLIADTRERGVAIGDLVVSGGPASLGALREAIASRLDMPVSRSIVPEASAVGAALLGLDGLGLSAHAACDRLPVAVASTAPPSARWVEERTEILRQAADYARAG